LTATKFTLSDEKKRSSPRRRIRSWFIEHPELNPYKFTWDRFYRKITSRFRMLPSFLIIGGSRSGTTSLFAHLIEHPNIIPGSMKEVYFFQYFTNNKTSFYRSHFPIKRKNLITCESTSNYFVHPLIPARVHKLLPSVKLIVVLRNPVERAYSEFQKKVNLGEQITENFEDDIKSELKRIEIGNKKPELKIGNTNYDQFSFSHLRHGLYAQHLEKWLKFFPKEQLLILHAKDLYDNLDNIIAETFEFLNLPKYQVENRIEKSKIDKIRPLGGHEHNIYKNIDSKTRTLFSVQNYPEMKSDTRKFLQDFFRPYNEKLFKMIGRRFDWNDEK
tara:strand:- start:1055 stop:2044 length:990 start_codon:yes stop_codon:yes gene_type:complete